MSVPESSLQSAVRRRGRDLLVRARECAGAAGWLDGLLERLMADSSLRLRALRFVDVLPTLTDDAAVVGHLRQYFEDGEFPLPGVAKWGLAAAPEPVLAAAVRKGVVSMAGRFLAGSDAASSLGRLRSLWDQGGSFSLDLLGEVVVCEAEAEAYCRRYERLLEELAPAVAGWPGHDLLDRCGPRVNLSIKFSALYSQATPLDPQGSAAGIRARLLPLLRTARRHGAAVCVDMEDYLHKPLVLETFKSCAMEPGLRDWPDFGIALQAYLKETEADLRDLRAWARERGAPVNVRLVRGAYWDAETAIARREGWTVPVWESKAETDLSYEHALASLFDAWPHLRPAVATHNPRSLAVALALAEHHGHAPGDFEFQLLYGMAEPLRRALVDGGWPVRVYTPFGDLLPGMAYLVRRLLENSESQSVQRLQGLAGGDLDALLAVPVAPLVVAPREAEFRNEPVCRFVDPGERQALRRALTDAPLARDWPLRIGGRAVTTGRWIESRNPARPEQWIGRVARAGVEQAREALAAAREALPAWSGASVGERSEVLLCVADSLRAQRFELAALEVREAGKPWGEADADVAEAIDFLGYYAGEARRMMICRDWNVPSEDNRYVYQARGVAVVIPPWNFPLAILVGMTTAALACGNTVVLKPSSLTPVLAARFVELAEQAGVPPGVLNFLPGAGGEVGDFLVSAEQVDLIAFTGSREVGLGILGRAAQVHGSGIPRVIAEMGGKNAIIVDADADPDEAIAGVLRSAFGYQGQKCSACSRVIVVGAGYEGFVRRLVDAAGDLRIGDPAEPGVFLGPVIDAAARDRILGFVERGRRVARLRLPPDAVGLPEQGWFVGPCIFSDVPPDSELAQEEIFGPVLSVMSAQDFEHALAIANATRYALTGGVYSRDPAHLERARQGFQVGNLYLNRKITGALVGRQPFGGFKLSGVGSKAGGPDYLSQFVQARSITENTLRKGFAPKI